MTAFHGIQAVLFDMDGTLVDSEGLTELAVNELVRDAGGDPTDLGPFEAFHGVTWGSIAASIRATFPTATSLPDAESLEAHFLALLRRDGPDEVPGSVRAVQAASESHRVALCTSSGGEVASFVLEAIGLAETMAVRVVAEDVRESKPAPEGFLLAASRVGVPPARCLVFEDSLAGLRAGRAAGMRTVAIVRGKHGAELAEAAALADATIQDFNELGADFFVRIGREESAS